MSRRLQIAVGVLGLAALVGVVFAATNLGRPPRADLNTPCPTATPTPSATPLVLHAPEDFYIDNLRRRDYPGGPIVTERVVAEADTYTKYAIHYPSDGLKITGLLTVPKPAAPPPGPSESKKLPTSWPAIILNHGYYPVPGYKPGDGTSREMDWLAARGYVVVAPDYRNHAGSDAYPDVYLTRPAYPIDVLNLTASLRSDSRVMRDRIGIWGHSMGGEVTLKAAVVKPDWYQAVVAYASMSSNEAQNYQRVTQWNPGYAAEYAKYFGTPASAPSVYAQMSPGNYSADLKAPVSIHHGTADTTIPFDWSVQLRNQLEAQKRQVQLQSYLGGGHILQGQLWQDFINRVTAFYDQQLKR